MKSYTKKLLSITSSLLIAAQQCFIAMPAGAVDTPSEAENFAQQIGLELNSNDAEEALSDLIDINDSDLGVSVDDNNNVIQINGLLSEDAVDNSNDAKDIIAKASELLGIDNVNRELRLDDVSESEYNRIYTFKQYYQGLEMVNSYVTVVVDKESGEAEFLNSSVVSDFSINTTPSITAQQAIDAVTGMFGQVNVSSHKLAVYSEDNDNFRLTWEIDTDIIGEDIIYVDAITGEIYYTNEDDETVDINHTITTNNVLLNNSNRILPPSVTSFNIDMVKDGSYYKLHDENRNLYFISDPSFYAYNDGGLVVKWTKSPDYTVKTTDSQFSSQANQYATAVVYNTEKTYDFYNNTLNYNGYDGKGSEMYIIPTLPYADKDGSNKRKWANASSNGNRINFGEGNDTDKQHFGSDIDVVAHEFTHSVTKTKVNWGGSSGETGALNEAYSDIMGEYVDTTREWQHGTDRFKNNTNKYTSNPKTYCGRDMRQRQNYVDSAQIQALGSHDGSVTISNVAYWMDHLGISANTAAKIWFTSLDYLPKGKNKATFNDCRTAMVSATQKVIQNKAQSEYVVKVKTAFNRVHIYDNNEILGDLTHDGTVDIRDLVALARATGGTMSLTPNERVQVDLNFDGKVNQEDVTILQKYLARIINEF